MDCAEIANRRSWEVKWKGFRESYFVPFDVLFWSDYVCTWLLKLWELVVTRKFAVMLHATEPICRVHNFQRVDSFDQLKMYSLEGFTVGPVSTDIERLTKVWNSTVTQLAGLPLKVNILNFQWDSTFCEFQFTAAVNPFVSITKAGTFRRTFVILSNFNRWHRFANTFGLNCSLFGRAPHVKPTRDEISFCWIKLFPWVKPRRRSNLFPLRNGRSQLINRTFLPFHFSCLIIKVLCHSGSLCFASLWVLPGDLFDQLALRTLSDIMLYK